MSTYKTEFPDFHLPVLIPEGFEDNSWHNDTTPTWYNTDYHFHLFIDYTLDKDRELPGYKQFALLQGDPEVLLPQDYDILAESDNFNDILLAIKKHTP